MKNNHPAHWAILEIGEQTTTGNSVDLWPRITAQRTSKAHTAAEAYPGRKLRAAAYVLVGLFLLVGIFFFVPTVRAFAENVIQRMGIAFADTRQFGPHAQVSKATSLPSGTNPSPSLSLEELQAEISFPLLVPAWLPPELDYIQRGVTKVTDPQNAQDVAAQLEYYRTADLDPDNGRLTLAAGKGSTGVTPLLAETTEQSVIVNGQPGIYVHGGWEDDGSGDPNISIGPLRWDNQADDAYLTWTQDGVTYLLEAHNLGLGLDELQKIAASMK